MNRLKSLFPILFLAVVAVFFFWKVLFNGYIIVTPAAGLGDITHGTLPYWKLLSEAYQSLRIPLWTDSFNGGISLISFPGSLLFFPITMIVLYFFKIPFALTLASIIYVLLLGLFTYLYCRTIGLSTNASLFCGAVFSYCGPVTVRIHSQFVIVIALFVATLFFLEKLLQTNKQRYIYLLAVVFALQIHASNPQITLYCLLISTIYLAFRLLFLKENLKQKISYATGFITSGIISLGLSAIILIPNLEFYSLSTRAKGITATLGDYPYSLMELILFVLPFAFGNPATASYSPPFAEQRLFWENTSYIGLIPLVLSLLGFFAARKNKYALIFVILFVLSITLSLGEQTPIGLILAIPPFSSFRVPSRFLIFASFSLVILAGFTIDMLAKKIKSQITIVTILLITISVFDLYNFCYTFNAQDKSSEWLKPPGTANFISRDKSNFRIYSIDDTNFNTNPYNQIFVQAGGWVKNISYHRFLFNWLPVNTNILFNIKSTTGYTSLNLTRFEEVEKEISDGINTNNSNAKISESTLKLLSIFGTKYLISPFEIKDPSLTLRYTTEKRYNLQFRTYENHNFVPNALLLTDAKVMKVEDIVKEMEKDSFDPRKTIILEKEQKLSSALNTDEEAGNVSIDKKKSGQEVLIHTNSKTAAYLLLTDIYYPGWHAYVDGRETEILKADYVFRAIPLNSGKHRVKFVYEPASFLIGSLITLFTIVTMIAYGSLSYMRNKWTPVTASRAQ